MQRTLPNWITAYMEYVENTEPARQFQLWSAFAVISSVLQRKCWLKLGRITVYPNLYVVLVAPPGVARKSQSIIFATEFLSAIPEVAVSADSITREALLDDLEKCASESLMPNGKTLRHSSLSIVSKEFESFLGQKKENNRMLVLLTDLYDCPVDTYKYRTKHSGSNKIEAGYLVIIAATTPDSLASSLPATAIGGGLTTRILFIWGDKKYKKVARPIVTPAEEAIKVQLINDLIMISQLSGEFVMNKEAEKKWDNYYNFYDEMSHKRLCQDPSFDGFYSRKPMHIIKISMCIAATKRQETIVEWKDILEAISFIESIEVGMGNSFRAVGKSLIASEVDTVLEMIKSRGIISEKQIMSILWKDMDSDKFDNCIETAIRTGKVKRGYVGPAGEMGGIWYSYIK